MEEKEEDEIESASHVRRFINQNWNRADEKVLLFKHHQIYRDYIFC